MKKLSAVKVVGIIAVTVVILIIAGFAALWILIPPERAKELAVEQLGKTLGRDVRVEKAGISLFPVLGVSLKGMEVSNTTRPGFSSEAFVSVDRFLVQISFMSIIHRRPVIRKIIISKPAILIEVDSAGAFNFDDLAVMAKDSAATPEKKSEGGVPALPVPISLKKFVIEDGRFIFSDARAGQDVVVDDIDDRIDFTIDDKLKDVSTTGELSLAGVSVKTPELSKPLNNFTVTLQHDIGADLVEGNVDIAMLRLSFQKVFLNLAGNVTGLNGVPELDLAVTSDPILLQDLLKEIPVELAPVLGKLTAAGELLLGLELKGTLEKDVPFPVKGTVSIREGMVKYRDLPKSINKINAACAFTENSLAISSLKMYFGENPVALTATVNNFKEPEIDLKLRSRFNLEDAKDLAELPEGTSLSGHMDVDVRASGKADPAAPEKLDVRGKLDLKNVSVLWPPLVKPAVINGGFTLSSKAIGERLSVVIGRSNMQMNATVKDYLSMVFADSTKKMPRPQIDFSVTSAMLDIDEFMPPSEEGNKEAKEKKTEDGPLIAPLPGVDTRGKISGKKVIYNGIPMRNVTITVNLINDIADLVINGGFAGGTIGEKIHADLRNPNNISFTNKMAVKNVEIADLITNFGGFIQPTNALNRELRNIQNSLTGKINFTSDLSGQGGTSEAIVNSLNGNITASVRKGTISNSLILKRLSGTVEKFVKLDDISFRNLSAALQIANSSVIFKDLKIVSNMGDWSAGGSVGFDTRLDMLVNNRLTKQMSSKVLKVQSGGKDILKGLVKGTRYAKAAGGLIDDVGIPTDKQGRVTLKLALTGTASDPKASFAGFGEGTVKQKKDASVKQQAVKRLKDEVNKKKAEAQQKIAEERKKAEALAKQKVEAQKRAAEEKKKELKTKKKSVEKNLKKNAKNKLKKLF